MPSSALERLIGTRLPEVRSLDRIRPTGRTSDELACDLTVNRAAVVLTSAHLEGFLEDLIGEFVDYINEAQPKTERLPLLLLASQVEAEVEAIAGLGDPAKRAERLGRLFRGFGSLWLEAELSTSLTTNVVTQHLSNPGSTVISRVLARIGLEDVFAAAALPDGSPVDRRINELVGIRNAVAHGDEVHVTRDQVDRYLEGVEVLGRSLDETAARRLQDICESSELPWP